MRTKRLIAVLASVAVLAVLPQVAVAQETDRSVDAAETDVREHPHTMDEIKDRAIAAIDRRLEALSLISAKVADNGHVTESHAAALQRDYAATTDGLRELARSIEGAETREELRELIPAIAEDFRVYLVILPKSHVVLVSDAMADAVDRLHGVADTLLAAIERAADAGFDMTEAMRWLDIARTEIAAVETGAVPVADTVIDLTATDWEEPAKSLLAEGKQKLETARGDLGDAVEALKNTRKAIREAIG